MLMNFKEVQKINILRRVLNFSACFFILLITFFTAILKCP
jgi:hypothetical protein